LSDFQLSTPIAFIIFNRPDITERVFAEIAKAKPPKLFVVGDGARVNREGEAAKVAATRAIIDRVDWPCEVLTNFSDINLGCDARISSGLDWVFKHVEEAIVLEDDCLPHPTFFRFCEEMLTRYCDDARIGMISGDNFQFGLRLTDESYYFSNISNTWGWASWRSRWQNDYDFSMKNWSVLINNGGPADLFPTQVEQDFFSNIFEKKYKGKIIPWDYKWFFGLRFNGRIAVMPNVNLISNIGFGEEATHTKDISILANMELQEMVFPLKHPDGMFASTFLDKRYFENFIARSLYGRVKARLINLLRKYES
jgi:hypothetical protein